MPCTQIGIIISLLCSIDVMLVLSGVLSVRLFWYDLGDCVCLSMYGVYFIKWIYYGYELHVICRFLYGLVC